MRHKDDAPKTKKPYEPPTLKVYGTVRQLTESQGSNRPDNRSNPFSHTGHA